MKLIFDVGMYDGADTSYYLECGHRVVAIEANPSLVERATRRFSAHIESGQLVCLNAAISPDGGPVELNLCGEDLGSSSLLNGRVAERWPLGAITVPGVNVPPMKKSVPVMRFKSAASR